jgi:hypothetical protein
VRWWWGGRKGKEEGKGRRGKMVKFAGGNRDAEGREWMDEYID